MMTYIFVYGIFKRGPDDMSPIFRDCEWLGPAKAPGFVLLDHSGSAAMVPGANWTRFNTETTVKGEVIAVPDDRIDKVLADLDDIENNGHSYIRAKLAVQMADREVEAYAYLWISYYNQYEILANGTWR